jgi:hypothetical protein
MTKVEIAEALGRKAFENGIKGAPVLDPDVMSLLVDGPVGSSKKVLKAWLKGWHEANLEALVTV